MTRQSFQHQHKLFTPERRNVTRYIFDNQFTVRLDEHSIDGNRPTGLNVENHVARYDVTCWFAVIFVFHFSIPYIVGV
nr:MAG TPA_asm: major prion protein [Caudoviricetes sp.]